MFIRIPRPEATAEGRAGRGSLLHETAYGWKYITARSGLLALLVFLALANFLMEMSVVLFTPMILSFASTAALGMVMALAGIGYLVGSVIMSIWGGPKRRVQAVMVSMLFMGVFMTLIGLRASLPLVAVSACLCMVFLPITVSANQAIWQSRVAPDVQGRVFAIRQAFIQAMPLLAAAGITTRGLYQLYSPLSYPAAQIQVAGTAAGSSLREAPLNRPCKPPRSAGPKKKQKLFICPFHFRIHL